MPLSYPTTFIYTLSDPRTGFVRYVGKSNDPKNRLARHLCESRAKQTCHRHCWIASLLKEGVLPQLLIIEECDRLKWPDSERFWIASLRLAGCDLVNRSDGGSGNDGYKFSDELRAQFSAQRKGRPLSERNKQNIAAALRGMPKSPEHRAKLSLANIGKTGELSSAFGRKQTPEARAKISAGHMGKTAHNKGKAMSAAQWEGLARSYIVTSPEGEEQQIKGLAKFCRETGLALGTLSAALSGRLKHCKGWKIRPA